MAKGMEEQEVRVVMNIKKRVELVQNQSKQIQQRIVI
jgi:hypothetical protein